MNHTNRAQGKLSLIYPFDFSATGEFEIYARDDDGIPLVYYPHLQRSVYNPITIAQYGLHKLALFARSQSAVESAEALRMADWLVANLEPRQNDIGAWVFHFDLPFYGPKQPWISALTQGQGISLLLRAHQIRRNPVYEEAAQCAVRAFYHAIPQGGIVSKFHDGSQAFEEYPTVEPSLVLNGMLFALLGLHDHAEYFNDSRALVSFKAGLLGVKKNLHRYDTGYWNLYDLHRSRRLASPMYVDIHVRLLEIFAEMTREEIFADTARKWLGYLASSICRAKFYGGKVLEKVRLRFNNYQPIAPDRV